MENIWNSGGVSVEVKKAGEVPFCFSWPRRGKEAGEPLHCCPGQQREGSQLHNPGLAESWALGCRGRSDQEMQGEGWGPLWMQQQPLLATSAFLEEALPLVPVFRPLCWLSPCADGINLLPSPNRTLWKVGLFHETEKGRWALSSTARGEATLWVSHGGCVSLNGFGMSPGEHTDTDKLTQTELGGYVFTFFLFLLIPKPRMLLLFICCFRWSLGGSLLTAREVSLWVWDGWTLLVSEAFFCPQWDEPGSWRKTVLLLSCALIYLLYLVCRHSIAVSLNNLSLNIFMHKCLWLCHLLIMINF